MPLMEDVDMVRRIGPRALTILTSPAITSAERYRKTGYVSRVLRNWRCLWLYARGVPVERILEIYER